MRPENESLTLLGVTRARAKMYEYDVPESAFIKIVRHPEELLLITIAILGDFNNRSQQTDFEPQEEKQNMLFSAQFFDAFLNSRLNHNIGNYLLILGSAAYYLCDLPGSSKVLIGQVEPKFPDIEADGLEYLLVGLLCDSFDDLPTLPETFSAAINDLVQAFLGFKANGTEADGCRGQIQKLKRLIYQSGTDRQLLLIDTISSVMEKRIRNSSWTLLPAFTTTDLEAWRNVINKPDFIKEFWPAQILLGEQEVYKGKSAVIQMPTSAGKTRSIELILRSNFITTGSGLAVIVAPFKALCNEIKHTLQTAFAGELIRVDAPTDAFQLDFDFAEESEQDQAQVILILTPEKFLYMIRQSPEMADDIGLLVYDEGHQFDNGSRGVTYELLLSSLRLAVSPQTQIILISAVIQNAEAI